MTNSNAAAQDENISQKCYKDYAKTAVFINGGEQAFSEWGKLYLKSRILPHLPTDKSSSFLEVGCGYGRYLKTLLEMGYENVFGVDISEDQIQCAKKLGMGDFVEHIDGLSFLQDKDSCYDVILLLDVVEHLPTEYSLDLLEKVYLALRSGGRVVIQVPNALAPLSPLRYSDFTHLRAFTPSSMRQALSLCNFKNMQHYPLPPIVHGLKSMARRIIWEGAINPLINLYILTACGERMGGIYTPNMLTIAIKD